MPHPALLARKRLLCDLTPALRRLLVSDILVRFCEQIPYAFVVVWAMKTIHSPVNAFQFGVLTSIEMATAMLIYIPVAYLADRGGKKPFVVTKRLRSSRCFLLLLYSQSFWVLAGGVRGPRAEGIRRAHSQGA